MDRCHRIKHHIQHTEFYSARFSATMSSSDCTERRKQQQCFLSGNRNMKAVYMYPKSCTLLLIDYVHDSQSATDSHLYMYSIVCFFLLCPQKT